MDIKELTKRSGIEENKKLYKAYTQFEKLLVELSKKEISDKICVFINSEIEQINSVSEINTGLRKQLKKSQSSILKLLEKELKIVVKNHYRKTWLAIGMSAFGIPLGVVFGVSLGNMAFLGIGLPIGMAFGIAFGSEMDKKAFNEGRQIDWELES